MTVDQQHVMALKRSLDEIPSRRDVLRGLAAIGIGLAAARLPAPVAAQTQYGCRKVGDRCKRASRCCSGRCTGKRGKKKCRAHDAGICKAGQDACITSATACQSAGTDLCYCFVTTSKASFCGLNGGTPISCTRDAECVTAKGQGAACIPCGDVTYCVARCPTPA